jgi:hypothetical protein
LVIEDSGPITAKHFFCPYHHLSILSGTLFHGQEKEGRQQQDNYDKDRKNYLLSED